MIKKGGKVYINPNTLHKCFTYSINQASNLIGVPILTLDEYNKLNKMTKESIGLDLNRLHLVHLGESSGRGCGKTFLFASYLVGISELDDYKFKKIPIRFKNMKLAISVLNTIEEYCYLSNIYFNRGKKDSFYINSTLYCLTTNSSKSILPLKMEIDFDE